MDRVLSPIQAAATTTLVVALGVVALSLSAAAGAGSAAKPLCFGKPATIIGKPGADYLVGKPRADVIVGLGGNDRIEGRGGNDLVCGGAGSDTLVGGAGVDRLDGGPGFDTCRGGEKLANCEETRPGLPQQGPLVATSYVTDLFVPHLSFRLGTGWYSGGEAPNSLALFRGPRQGGEPGILLDSVSSGKPVAEVVNAVAAEPLLNATAASPVTVAGASGQRFEVKVADVGRLVPVPGMSRAVDLPGDYRARLDVVSVGGRTVTIIAVTPAAQFEGFLPLADDVLATVQFRR